VPGPHAEAPLSIPAVKQVRARWGLRGLLDVGAWKTDGPRGRMGGRLDPCALPARPDRLAPRHKVPACASGLGHPAATAGVPEPLALAASWAPRGAPWRAVAGARPPPGNAVDLSRLF